MIFLYIILVLVALVALWFAFIAIASVVTLLVQGFLLATGRTTVAELNEKAEKIRQAKAEKKRFKPRGTGLAWFDYPYPLNMWL